MPLFAQKEGHVWHFAFKAGLNFNNPGNIIDTSSAMETIEGSAAISDADGNLLFYTNGGRSRSHRHWSTFRRHLQPVTMRLCTT